MPSLNVQDSPVEEHFHKPECGRSHRSKGGRRVLTASFPCNTEQRNVCTFRPKRETKKRRPHRLSRQTFLEPFLVKSSVSLFLSKESLLKLYTAAPPRLFEPSRTRRSSERLNQSMPCRSVHIEPQRGRDENSVNKLRLVEMLHY